MLIVALGAANACGGASTRLITVHPASGKGDVVLEVQNRTDVPINTFYLAKSDAVAKGSHAQDEPGSTAEAAVWHADLLGNALQVGERTRIPVPGPGRWDARAVDRNGRYQHIAGLRLGSGGHYILELHEGAWHVFQ